MTSASRICCRLSLAECQLVGLVMLTASWGTTLNGWVICYA